MSRVIELVTSLAIAALFVALAVYFFKKANNE